MLQALETYFAAEKAESLIFLGLGICAIVVAALALWRGRDPLFKGLAIPLLLVGAIQVGVGATIFVRTDAQVVALKAQYQADPAAFKTQELARMKAVREGFVVYKAIEIAFIAIGLVLALLPSLHRFWRGIGLGMLLQGALMLPADLAAEDRTDAYLQAIQAIG